MAATQAVNRRVRFLTAEQVVHVHNLLLERFGGAAGGASRALMIYCGAVHVPLDDSCC